MHTHGLGRNAEHGRDSSRASYNAGLSAGSVCAVVEEVPGEDDSEFAAAFEKATPDGLTPDGVGPDGLLASDTG